MLASPSNPTGTIIEHGEITRICDYVGSRNGVVIADEIYHGLVYGDPVETAARYNDHVIVINSFSKYFGMTGWRVGWLVAPRELVGPIDHLAQNIFLSVSTPAQHAAVAALSASLKPALDERRDLFRQRRDYLLAAINETGFNVPALPQGAFYIYADSSGLAADSLELSQRLLEHAGVAITPGLDFGSHGHADYVRFAYTTGMDRLVAGIESIQKYLGA